MTQLSSTALRARAALQGLEIVADCSCELGENPLWHPTEHRVYWCDINRGRIFRYDPASGLYEKCYEGRPIGGFTIQSDGSLLFFMDRGRVAIWREGVLIEIVPEVLAERSSRFNDVIADPRGRVLCGTVSTDKSKGRLYRLDVDGSLHLLLEGIGCSNGMAFTLDRKGLYYTDSFAREIYLFDYDVDDGTISNRRVFARFGEMDGLPDGATLDSEGTLWSALWDGSSVVGLRKDGRIEKRIAVPTRKVTSITFGGMDYTDIYITTAGGHTKDEDGPFAGGLFRMKALTPGLPEYLSSVQIPTQK
jgi:sugar lactone lactonase YvrE